MNKTILVIEDDPGVLKNIKILLKSQNYEVFTAQNGFDGVKSAKLNHPDLIICDIMMPKMDGYEVLKTLSLDSQLNSIPFLFLTAKIENKDLRLGMELGADDYLLKPYDAAELLKAVEARIKKFMKIKSLSLDKINDTAAVNKNKFNGNDTVFIKNGGKPLFIKIKSIIYIKAERQYVRLYFNDNSRLVMRKSLSYWEKILPDNLFARIHRSTIININKILKIEKQLNNSFKIVLQDNFGEFRMSRNYATLLKSRLL